jgi:predicted nucleotidyltransferase
MLQEGDLARELVRRFDARVVILYGSHARGEAGPGSDVDVICFCESNARHPLTFHHDGMLIDAWLQPLEDLQQTGELDKLHGGRVLLDLEGRGAALLSRVNARFAEARPPLAPEQERHLRAWVWKMLDRARQADVHGAHRRHWLLHDLPEIWCDLTGRHFQGAQSALREMMQGPGELGDALQLAMRPEASLDDIQALATLIAGPRPG